VTILTKTDTVEVPLASKDVIADAVLDRVVALLDGQEGRAGAPRAEED
jgi:hypothetical protein